MTTTEFNIEALPVTITYVGEAQRDGWPCDGSEQAVRAWPVKVENGKVWVGNQQLLARAEAS